MFDRRSVLAMLPGLALAPRLLAQTPSTKPRFKVNGLSQITLSVSDVQRSLAFYQGLFGMAIQARQGATVVLRIGSGPLHLTSRIRIISSRDREDGQFDVGARFA